MPRITSRQNPAVKRFRAAATTADGEILIDGAHLVHDAIAAGVPLDVLAVVEDAEHPELMDLAARAERAGATVLAVTAPVLSAMTPVRQPTGIAALAARPVHTVDQTLSRAPGLVLLLDQVQDPGNVGAIIRVADACGATGVIVGQGSADAYGWKALRASMGSAFRIPVAQAQRLGEVAQEVRGRGLRLLATCPRGGTPLPACDMSGPAALLLGGEGPGLAQDLLRAADELVTIPMRAGVESLNVAAAAAMFVYEALRQRTSIPS